MGMGQNIIFGVMKIVNFCHGEMLMLGMYLTFLLYTYAGIDPYLALPIVAVIMFLLGTVIQHTLITPSLKSGILPGTMRRFVMEHFDVQECSITTEMLYRSTELFVTNALLGIMPVTNFQGKVYVVGKVTKKITIFYEKIQVSST